MSEGYVTTGDGVKLFYRREGSGQSTVIVPNALYLYDDFKYLTPDHTVIFYDLRNRGRSSEVTDQSKLSRGILNDVDDLEAIRQHFGIDKVSLIGHSYLGLMVVLYAMQHPDHVERLVQIGPMQFDPKAEYPERLTAQDDTPIPDPEALEKLAQLEVEGYHLSHPEEYARKWWSAIRPAYVTNPADTGKIFSEIEAFPNEWPQHQMEYLTENILPSIQNRNIGNEEIAKCGVPVLTIHGTMDRAVPYGAGREWVSTLPQARLLTIDGGGHFPWIESPERVFSALRVFLNGEWPKDAEQLNQEDDR